VHSGKSVRANASCTTASLAIGAAEDMDLRRETSSPGAVSGAGGGGGTLITRSSNAGDLTSCDARVVVVRVFWETGTTEGVGGGSTVSKKSCWADGTAFLGESRRGMSV